MRSIDESENAKTGRHQVAVVLERASFYSALLMAVVVPLAIAPFAYDQVMSIKAFVLRALAVTSLALWAIKGVVAGFRVRWSPLFWVAMALVFLALLSTILSVSPMASLSGAYLRYEGLTSLLIYAALLFLAVQHFDSERKRLALAKAVVVGAVIVAIYGIIQGLGLDPIAWGSATFEMSRTFSTLGNPIVLGGYLAVAFAIALALAISSKGAVRSAQWAAACAVIAVPLATSLSRGAWIAAGFGAALALLAVAQLEKGRTRRRLKGGAIAIAVAAVALSAGYLAGAAEGPRSRLLTLASPLQGSGSSRIEIWKSAISMMEARPILGSGPDTFGLVFPRYETLKSARLFPETLADNAHNLVLQTGATLGIPALLSYLALIGAYYVEFFRRGRNSAAQIAFAAGIAAFFAQSLFSVNVVASTFLLWLLIGATGPSSDKAFGFSLTGARKAALCVAVTAVAVAAIGISASFFAADVAAGQGALEVGHGDFAGGISKLRLATALNPWNPVYFRELSSAYQSAALAEKRRALFDESIFYMKEALRLEPYGVYNYVLLGRILAYGGEAYDSRYYDGAEEVLVRAIELRKYSPSAHRVLGFVYLKKGREEKALAELNASLNVNPMDERTYFYKGQALEKLGFRDEALDAYRASLRLKPDYGDAEKALRKAEAGI